MINLDKQSRTIENFIRGSIEKFKVDNNREPTAIGIYCCPWAGWLTTNFNISKTLNEADNNCPDFEFVEFDFLELDGWQDEYETSSPIYTANGLTIQHDHDLGDEKLNELFFKYLEPTVIKLKAATGPVFLLQMLGSRFTKSF